MKAIITGINGQDGSYLAEFLLKKGYEVHGIVRRHSVSETQSSRVNHLLDSIHLHYADMTDFASLLNLIQKVKPDEIYNLAAQSHVKVSEEMPLYTIEADMKGVMNLLEILRALKSLLPMYQCKLYQASTSEMFGNPKEWHPTKDGRSNERTPFNPVSPYGIAKLAAHQLCGHYRKAYGMYVTCGILFNHTSPRRGENFVEQKIVKGLVEVKLGLREYIELGNLEATRDIGYAPEFVEGMWRMMQLDKSDDFVVGTGQAFSIREIADMVIKKLDLHDSCILINDKYKRAQELNDLNADMTKAEFALNWKPRKLLPDTLGMMVDHWLEVLKPKLELV